MAATLRRDTFAATVELNATAGEVVGLTGGLGTGKSSTLWLIAGRLKADTGIVTFDGDVWDEPASSTFVPSRPVSLMAQNYLTDLPDDLTGTEIVRRNIEQLDTAELEPDKTARAALSGLGIEDVVADRLPWTFSGAESQRIALARALAPRPAILLLDEPFGALDKRTGAAVRDWLAEWLASFQGIAIVASTRVDHLETLTDRTLSLDP